LRLTPELLFLKPTPLRPHQISGVERAAEAWEQLQLCANMSYFGFCLGLRWGSLASCRISHPNRSLMSAPGKPRTTMLVGSFGAALQA